MGKSKHIGTAPRFAHDYLTANRLHNPDHEFQRWNNWLHDCTVLETWAISGPATASMLVPARYNSVWDAAEMA